MNAKTIGIVIVNYNGEKFQNECIDSILKSTYQDFYIIVVDNGSKDNSIKMLKKYADDRIILIENKENFGVAKGNNIGIKKSIELGTKKTILLNNDTVLSNDCIEKVVELSKNEKIVVPKILFWNSKNIWYAGGKFVKYKCVTKHLYYKNVDDGNLKFEKYYEYAPTCFMLIDNSVFDDIGFMDEKFFLYFDDTDFCMRLLLKNIHIAFCSEAYLYHKVSMSSGGSHSKVCTYYENRNRFYFYNKYKNYFPKISYAYFYITRKIRYYLGVIKKNNDVYIKKAILDYKNNKMGRCEEI